MNNEINTQQCKYKTLEEKIFVKSLDITFVYVNEQCDFFKFAYLSEEQKEKRIIKRHKRDQGSKKTSTPKITFL